MGDFQKHGNAYSQELAYSNRTILLPGMSPDPLGVLVSFDFQNYSFLLTYLLTYLKVINPHSSGIAADIVTKLRELNDSPLGGKTARLG